MLKSNNTFKRMHVILSAIIILITAGPIIAQHRPTLEPHVLAGKRLVFTNWYFVRPPFFDWLNDKGESDLGIETGTPVYFRFKMKFAKLYSLDFE